MNTSYEQPFLHFDFHTDIGQPISFTQPIDIISTSRIDDVLNCFRDVENALDKGYYVAGYVSYEATYGIHSFENRYNFSKSTPLVWFGVFKDPCQKDLSNLKTTYEVDSWQLAETETTYQKKFKNIIEKMREKNIDQINYTLPFYTHFSGDSLAYYRDLRENQRGSFSAFLHIGNQQILSISPELFFQLDKETITVKPMKGTIHRGKTYEEDLQLKEWLASSHKNKSENEMVTKLMKKELANIVEPSSLRVTEPFKIEQYPTVYQMISTIQGKLREQIKITDIFKALFPSSSISGVPKQKAVQLIRQFENTTRDVYCGAIGYITPLRQAIFNVPIRTVIIDQSTNKAKFSAGGAITFYSNPTEEYAEILTKAKVLEIQQPFQLLETFGLKDGEFIVFHEHMKRLKNSALYFNFHIDISTICENLLSIKNNYRNGDYRVRLTVEKTGNYNIEISELNPADNRFVKLAKNPIDKNNIFHYHKTTNRFIYEKHMIDTNEVFDVLLWNEENEITEFTIGNVVVELDGKLYTPPVQCGLLPGTFREKLLKDSMIEERVINKDELKACSNIYLINSVRQWVKVELL